MDQNIANHYAVGEHQAKPSASETCTNGHEAPDPLMSAHTNHQRVLRLATALFDVSMGMVGRRSGDRLIVETTEGIAEETESFARVLGNVVLRLEEPLVVEDTHTDTRFERVKQAATASPIRFFAGVPLRAGGECVGVLCVMEQSSRAFTEVQMQQLADFAALIGDATPDGADATTSERKMALLEGAVESTLDAILTIDEDHRIVWVNPAAKSLFGCSTADVLGRPVDDLIPEDLRARHAEHVRRFETSDKSACRMGEAGPIRARRLNGEAFWADASVSKVEVDGQTYYTVILRDVTEREETLQALKTSQDRYQLIVDTVQEVVFQVDAEGRWTYLNPAWTELTGFDVEETIGDYFLDYVHPDDRAAARESFESGVDSAEEGCHEFRYLTKDGGFEWVAIHVRPVQREESSEAAGTITCVTERRAREEELRRAKEEAEKMNRLKSAFLANMSHEIRTPLTAIIGFAELIDEDPETAQQFAGSIRRSGQRLLRTLNSVLDLAQIESDEMMLDIEPVDVVAEARNALDSVALQAEEKGLALRMEAAEAPCWVHADGRALQRVFDNLLSNAVKFTETGHVAVRITRQNDAVAIVIEDTGIGMSDSFQREMFESFTQESMGNGRTHEGSGLGLAIVSELMRRMDGTIEAESAPNEGTTFTITLPVAPSPPDAS